MAELSCPTSPNFKAPSPVARNVAKSALAAATDSVRKRTAEEMPIQPAGSQDRSQPTAAQLAEEEAEAQWMEGLTQSHTGRKLCDFLGHVHSVLDDGDLSIECPIDQAVSFRRVLIRALERNPAPFGLPKKLPKFIAMVQLCGERLLLTTELGQLFQLLAHAPCGKRANSDAICAMVNMIKYREAHPECTLLLTYSAPFQVDLAKLWWDVRTLRRDPHTLKVIDGEMAFQIGQAKCRAIGCTSALENEVSAATLDREVKAFEENISAVDLDIELKDLAGAPSASDASSPNCKKIQAALSMARGLQTERNKLIADHAAEVAELTKLKEKAQREAGDAARLAYETERESEKALNREINRLAKECEASIKAVDEQKRLNEMLRKEHKSETSAAMIRKDEEIDALKTKLATAETSLRSKEQELARAGRQNDAQTRKLEAQHQRSLDGMERKLQKLTMAERTAKQEGEEMAGRLTTLSSVMEGRDAEKEALQHQLVLQRRSSRVLRGLLAVGVLRHGKSVSTSEEQETQMASDAIGTIEDLQGKLRINEMALSQVTGVRDGLLVQLSTTAAERDSLGEANARLQTRLEESATNPPAKPEAANAETMTVPITSEADLRLGELETANVKLKDELVAKTSEIATLKGDLARSKSKAAKKQVPAGLMPDDKIAAASGAAAPVLGVPSSGSNGGGPYNIVTNVHVGGNGGQMANTDLGHAPDVDANVEHIIAQAASTLRILADAARDSSRHKQAACEGWAQARALQSYTGYQMPPQQQQWHPMPQQQQHSPNGYMHQMGM